MAVSNISNPSRLRLSNLQTLTLNGSRTHCAEREHLVLLHSQTTSTHHIDSSGTAASLKSALGAGGRVVCEVSGKRWEGLLSVVYNRDVDVPSYSHLLQKYYVDAVEVKLTLPRFHLDS